MIGFSLGKTNSSYIAGETWTVSWLSVNPHRSRRADWPPKSGLRQLVAETPASRADVGAVVVEAQKILGLQVIELVEMALGEDRAATP